MRPVVAAAKWLARTLAIVLLVIIGSTLLVRLAPGYLSDARDGLALWRCGARGDLRGSGTQPVDPLKCSPLKSADGFEETLACRGSTAFQYLS